MVEREALRLDDFANVVPAAEGSEGIDVLEEKLPGLQGALERNSIDQALEFAIAIKPRRERGKRFVIGILPTLDGMLDNPVALVAMLGDLKVGGEELVRGFGQGMVFNGTLDFLGRDDGVRDWGRDSARPSTG